ncbi:MAG: RecB family exonuclease [Nocardioides sp.]
MRSSERRQLALSEVFAWEGARLMVTNPEVLESLRPPALSPSASKSMSGCGARWAAEKCLPEKSDPFGAAELGTSVHTVLEDLFGLEPDQRAPQSAMNILLAHAEKQWPATDDESAAKRGIWIAEVHERYKPLWDMTDPSAVSVHSLETELKDVEVEGVPFIGYVDRIEHVEGGLKLVDTKTGSVPKNITRFGDDHGDQMRLYKAAAETKLCTNVVELELQYTRHGRARTVPLSDQKMRATLAGFKKGWATMNRQLDRGSFDSKVTPLCGWCPMVNSCPAAAAEGKVARVDNLPTDLGIPVVKPYGERADAPPSMDLDFGSASESIPDPSAHGAGERQQPERKKADTNMNFLTEDKPWEEISGGALNPNSYAAVAVWALATLAYEEITAAGVKPTRDTVDGLTGTFNHMVTQVVTEHLTGTVDWQSGAHKRVRGALHAYFKANPIPFGKDADAWDEWVTTGIRHMWAMSAAAIRLHSADLSGRPWSALVEA